MDEKLHLIVKSKIVNGIFLFLFLVYLALLIKVILFKYSIHMIMNILKSKDKMPLSFRIIHSNFVPTKTIIYYLSGKQGFRTARQNILGNIIAFAPFGFLLPIVVRKAKKFKYTVAVAFLLSLIFEIIQLLSATGEFDIDDIILNVIGSICGYIVYKGCKNLINFCLNLRYKYENIKK